MIIPFPVLMHVFKHFFVYTIFSMFFYKIITTVQQKLADQSLESLKYNALQHFTKHYMVETDLVALLGSRGLTE